MKPKVIEHLISIGFEEIIGEWRPVWGQGDGEYWLGKLVRDTDIVYIDRNTTFFKYSYNGIITNEEFLMTLKKETTMKTAVESLIQELPKGDFDHQQIAIKQALEMEKQQIKDAYKKGCFDNILDESTDEVRAEQYYNEKFKK